MKEVTLNCKRLVMYSCRYFKSILFCFHENNIVKRFYEPPAILNCMICYGLCIEMHESNTVTSILVEKF